MSKIKFLIAGLSAFLMTLTIVAQNTGKRVLGTVLIKKQAYNYECVMLAANSYTLRVTAAKEAFKIAREGDTVSTSPVVEDIGDSATAPPAFREMSLQIFQEIFLAEVALAFPTPDEGVKDAAKEAFFNVQGKLIDFDDEPVSAYFILKKDFVKSLLHSNNSNYYRGKLSPLIVNHHISAVEVETKDGAIKNISIVVEPPNGKGPTLELRDPLIFKNQFPISISGKFDYEKFSKINLYCYNCEGYDGLTRYIPLMDLVVLRQVYAVDKEDYSPSNRTFTVSPTHPIEELKKERRSRILEMAAFSDFMGLDRSEPNGLIQIEVKRRIVINSKSRLIGRPGASLLSKINTSDWHIPAPSISKREITYKLTNKRDTMIKRTLVIPARNFHTKYFTLFNYIEPKLLFSKLEENNRFVDSAKAGGGAIDPVTLYQYQLAQFGLQFQVLRINVPQAKFQWNILTLGAFWSRTRIALSSDSAGPSKPINSNFWELGSQIIFFPDSRWGASCGIEYMLPRIWNDEYKITPKRGLFQQQFDGWRRIGEDGKLFFRFRWTHQNGRRNNNFTQVQLGYSMSLFAGANPDRPNQ